MLYHECADVNAFCFHEVYNQGWREARRAKRWRKIKIILLYTVAGGIFLLGMYSLQNMDLAGRWVTSLCFGWVMGDLVGGARQRLL